MHNTKAGMKTAGWVSLVATLLVCVISLVGLRSGLWWYFPPPNGEPICMHFERTDVSMS